MASVAAIFSKNLKRLRTQANLTQPELGKALGVSGITILYWENGKRWPGIESIEDIAKFFKVDEPDLFLAESRPAPAYAEAIKKFGELLAQAEPVQLRHALELLEPEQSLGKASRKSTSSKP